MSKQRKSLLFFTNSEWGQANVILATIHEFLVRDEYDIHLASYSPLKSRLHDLFQTHASAYPRPLTIAYDDDAEQASTSSAPAKELESDSSRPSLTFHTIAGLSLAETVHHDNLASALPHAPGLRPNGAIPSYPRLAEFMVRWTVDEYMVAERSCAAILSSVSPALVLAEQGCNHGLDACQQRKLPFVILSPNSFKDFEQYMQPPLKLGILWKMPALASGYPFPVPWRLVPANVYLWVRMLIAVVGTAMDRKSRLAVITEGRQENGLEGPLPIVDAYKKARAILCPSLPELDFAMKVRDTTIGCGPIVLPARPVAELDPELDAWLHREGRRTVLVNLGTHYSMDGGLALEVAQALANVLDRFPDIQILWKIMLKDPKEKATLDAVFSAHNPDGTQRIRMEAWLKPDPVALLATGRVATQVHHGGANTYFECCRFGVPQVVLPAWWDAARVEYLGIGVFANKKAAPRAETRELEAALVKVVEDESIRKRADEVAEVCRTRGEGRVVAHDCIVQMVESSEEI
jgi:hypothetical protein